MGLREREHVRIDPRAEVLERDPQRPEPSVPSDHRRRRGQQQAVPLVERLRPEPADPVDRVLQHARHRRVVFGRDDQERVCLLEAPPKLLGACWEADGVLLVRVVRHNVELAHRGELGYVAARLDRFSGQPRQLRVQRLRAERRRENEHVTRVEDHVGHDDIPLER